MIHVSRGEGIVGTCTEYRSHNTNSSFDVANLNHPICNMLPYVDKFQAFGFELMHNLFVNGIVFQVFNGIFEVYPENLSKTEFFTILSSIEFTNERGRVFSKAMKFKKLKAYQWKDLILNIAIPVFHDTLPEPLQRLLTILYSVISLIYIVR